MCDNTRPQTSAFIEYGHKKEADGSGIDHLADIGNQFHSTSIKQINNMSNSKQYAGHDNCSFYIILTHSIKQQSPENQFLKESDKKHASHIAYGICNRHIHLNTKPYVDRGQDNQREII